MHGEVATQKMIRRIYESGHGIRRLDCTNLEELTTLITCLLLSIAFMGSDAWRKRRNGVWTFALPEYLRREDTYAFTRT